MSCVEFRLRERISFLEEENRQLREALTEGVDLPSPFGLTPQQDVVLACLMREALASRKLLAAAMEAHLPSMGGRDPKVLHTAMCRIRRRLAGVDAEVRTVWGRGYQISTKDKAKIRAAVSDATPASRALEGG